MKQYFILNYNLRMVADIHYFGPNNIHPKSKKYIPEIESCKIKLYGINNEETIFENIEESSFHIYQRLNVADSRFIINNNKIYLKAISRSKYDLVLNNNIFRITSTDITFEALEYNLEDDDSSDIENHLHNLYKKIVFEFRVNPDNIKKLERCLTKLE